MRPALLLLAVLPLSAHGQEPSRLELLAPRGGRRVSIATQVPVVCKVPRDLARAAIVLEIRGGGIRGWEEAPYVLKERTGAAAWLVLDLAEAAGVNSGERIFLRARPAEDRYGSRASDPVALEVRSLEEEAVFIQFYVERLVELGNRLELEAGEQVRAFGRSAASDALLESERRLQQMLGTWRSGIADALVRAACSRVVRPDVAGRLALGHAALDPARKAVDRAVELLGEAAREGAGTRRNGIVAAAGGEHGSIMTPIADLGGRLSEWHGMLVVSTMSLELLRRQEALNAAIDPRK